jgi:serpin B
MQPIFFISFLFLTTSNLISATTTNPTTVHGQCQFAIDSAKQSSKAVSEFALKLYQKILASKPDDNLVFSPVSISLALALVSNGATGETRSEIQRYLSPPGSNQLDSSHLYQSLQRQLQIRGDKGKVNIANGFFYSDSLTLKEDYVHKIQQCFDTKIEKAPFATNSQEAKSQINRWVANITENKIPELFKQIESNVVAVLANAIYMKAPWSERFTRTETLPFYKSGKANQAQSVPFMIQQETYAYKATDNSQVVELPYEGVPLSMYILLPKERDGIKNLETSINGEQLRTIFQNTEQKLVSLKIPKFTIRSSIALKTILQQLGINKLFSNQAQLTNIADVGLTVSDAVHEAFIKVNENGTEAAAATGFKAVPLSAQIPPPSPVAFTADHPFLFAIIHKPTSAVLFYGKVNSVQE